MRSTPDCLIGSDVLSIYRAGGRHLKSIRRRAENGLQMRLTIRLGFFTFKYLPDQFHHLICRRSPPIMKPYLYVLFTALCASVTGYGGVPGFPFSGWAHGFFWAWRLREIKPARSRMRRCSVTAGTLVEKGEASLRSPWDKACNMARRVVRAKRPQQPPSPACTGRGVD